MKPQLGDLPETSGLTVVGEIEPPSAQLSLGSLQLVQEAFEGFRTQTVLESARGCRPLRCVQWVLKDLDILVKEEHG